MRKEYREHPKCTVGVGGMGCSCCSPMGCSPRKSKPLMRRLVRRKGKQKDYKGEYLAYIDEYLISDSGE